MQITLYGRPGETAVWRLALTDAASAPVDLTGATMTFRAELTDATDLAGTVAAYGTPTNGVCTVTCPIPTGQTVGTYRGWVKVNDQAWPTGLIDALRVQVQSDE